jgi:hypothetical protein
MLSRTEVQLAVNKLSDLEKSIKKGGVDNLMLSNSASPQLVEGGGSAMKKGKPLTLTSQQQYLLSTYSNIQTS